MDEIIHPVATHFRRYGFAEANSVARTTELSNCRHPVTAAFICLAAHTLSLYLTQKSIPLPKLTFGAVHIIKTASSCVHLLHNSRRETVIHDRSYHVVWLKYTRHKLIKYTIRIRHDVPR